MTLQEKVELVSLIVGAVATLLGGPAAIRKGLAWWAARRVERAAAELDAQKEVALARIHADQNDAERDANTEQQLWRRLDAVEADVKDTRERLDNCEERHAESEKRNEACERERVADRAKIEDLEGHVLALQDVALRNDNTGRFLIEQRTSPPPKPLDLPPPKRGG